MKRLLIVLFLLTLLSGCSLTDAVKNLFSSDTLAQKQVVLKTGRENIQLTVEVADDDDERDRGLMNRTQLNENAGMLFVFDDEIPRRFWMKNTLIPLDIFFFSSQYKIVHIVENMQPCSAQECSTYPSILPARYALELPGGFAKAKNVGVGDTLVISE